MNKEYRNDREYSLLDVLKYNLRKWWAAAILAAVFAVIIGGYKAATLRQYVDKEVYQDKVQVSASLFVQEYSSASVTERGLNIIKISETSRAYDKFREVTGYDIDIQEYRDMFEAEQTEASDVVKLYITYPYTTGDFSINETDEALAFMDGVLAAIDQTTRDLIGKECVTVLDAPYATKEVEKMEAYSITSGEYKQSVMKAITAGIILGIMVEVILYSLWMMLYKKPKDANEIQECLEAPVIEVIKKEKEDVETYKRLAMFLREDAGCQKINCIVAGKQQDTTALKVAMCYANQQKKTLFVDLNGLGESKNSVSKYIIGKEKNVCPEKMNEYLDALHRNVKEEAGFDIIGNARFGELIQKMEETYDCIIINGRDVEKVSESFEIAELCDKNIVICNRKSVKNELLYMVHNTAEVNGIHLDGVLVYDI